MNMISFLILLIYSFKCLIFRFISTFFSPKFKINPTGFPLQQGNSPIELHGLL